MAASILARSAPQLQRVGQQPDCLFARSGSLAVLQRDEATQAQAGVLGQFFLRQSRLDPMASLRRTEG